ncbi:MAG TPA: homocysteine S-methyltransferase family protein [Candidatus Limnocylindrales bacterium]|nr:homocysteine S-methyltransferase family protein [Candidatus Limnocylindrales bacterium]
MTSDQTPHRRSRRGGAPVMDPSDGRGPGAGPASDPAPPPATHELAPAPINAKWRALLAEGGTILADGAMGTMLFANGLQFGDPPETWNVAHPDVVRRIHRGYIDAGSRIVLTNTFGGNRLRLRLHGLESRAHDLNRTAAILLRAEADAAGGRALVAGDIGPSGEIMAPLGTLGEDEATDVFEEQARGLIAGGVDVIWVETMSHLSEITAAIRGARRANADIPIIATMTFDTRGHTMMGVSPEAAARALLEAGADAIGGNCGNGPDELLPVVEKMRVAAPGAVLVAKSNAGMPELIDLRAVYRADPATMAEAGTGFAAAGARIIGACCGSTPAHLAAMAEALGVARA